MATKQIDLNCDMGESYGRWTLGADEEIMPFITSANVACGFHGGDPHVMRKTVELALRHHVAIGSHPSLPDLIGFGRRVMDVTPAELKDYLCYQTGALREYCRAAGAELQHMKPHGILYTMIEKQPDQAWSTAIGEASKESGKELILMALASGQLRPDRAEDGRAGRVRGLRRPRLQRRSQPGLAQAARLAHHRSAEGGRPGRADGDGEQGEDDRRRRRRHLRADDLLPRRHAGRAERSCAAVREALDRAGCQVKPLRDWLPR